MASNFDPKLEAWIMRSVRKVLKDAPEMSGVTIQYPGMDPDDTEGDEDWVRFRLLDGDRGESRRSQYRALPMWQVSCISLFAHKRSDGSADAPWLLAGKVRKALEGNIEITEIGEVSPAVVGYLSMDEGSMQYLDRLPDRTDAHMVVVTFMSSFNIAA